MTPEEFERFMTDAANALGERLRPHIAALEADRNEAWSERAKTIADLHAAIADNAALVEEMGAISTTLEDKALRVVGVSQHTIDAQRTVIETAHRLAAEARAQSHPGAALLEKHREALAAAARRHETTRATMAVREEEHRKALVRARNEELEEAAVFVRAECGPAAAQAIRAMKEPDHG